MKCIINGLLVLILLLATSAIAASPYPNSFQSKRLYQTNTLTILGNPNGDVTIANFSDYQCEPCKEIYATLKLLVNQYPNLRVVIIDYPILGDQSVYSATAAVASKYQDKYLAMHEALMNAQVAMTQANVLSIAKKSGVNIKKLQQDMQSKTVISDLLSNMLLGNAFRVTATPAFVIGYTDSPHNTTAFIGANATQLKDYVMSYEQGLR